MVGNLHRKVNSEAETQQQSDQIQETVQQNQITFKEKTQNILSKGTDIRIKRVFAVKVIGESMSGTLESGDIVAARKVRAFTRYNKGDIIVFRMGEITIIHEIVGITTDSNGEVQYETKGVNNPQKDPWNVSKRDILGKVDISRSDLSKLLVRVEQGKTTLVEALGMRVTSALTSSYIIEEMEKILQEVYESSLKGFTSLFFIAFKNSVVTFASSVTPVFFSYSDCVLSR